MNRTVKTLALLLMSAVLGMTTACISVTYEGVEDLPPLPSGAKVGVYYEKSLIPVPESQYFQLHADADQGACRRGGEGKGGKRCSDSVRGHEENR